MSTQRLQTHEIKDVLRRVAERTLRFDMSEWFWGDAIAVDGLLEAAVLLDEPRFEQPCVRWLTRWMERFLGQGFRYTDHLVPGAALVRTAVRHHDDRMLEAARQLATFLHETVPRAHPSSAPLYRPDDPAYRHSVWVDTLYHEPTFFAQLAETTKVTRYADMAIQVVNDHLGVLYDEQERLLPQSVDLGNGTVHGLGWGRGHGWALLGLADTLAILPVPARTEIQSRALALSHRLLELQDASGYWHTLVQDRESYLETSTATFLGAAFFSLGRQGVVDCEAAADRALAAALSRIDEDGAVWGVSAVTWAATVPGPDANRYKNVPTECNLWGQGSAMRLLAEALRSRR